MIMPMGKANVGNSGAFTGPQYPMSKGAEIALPVNSHSYRNIPAIGWADNGYITPNFF